MIDDHRRTDDDHGWGCEYDPEKKAARYEGEGCTNIATLIVGHNGRWRLCQSCSELPEFSRLRVRKPIMRWETRSEAQCIEDGSV